MTCLDANIARAKAHLDRALTQEEARRWWEVMQALLALREQKERDPA